MQVFRLVRGGVPDHVIAFDSLPDQYLRTLKTSPPSGLPRHWARWLQENGSVDRNGKPVFYLLEYIMTNNDREAWQNIVNYVRRIVDTSFRLMDKIEDMAVPFAKDSRAEITLEPEDVPVVPVPKQEEAVASPTATEEPAEESAAETSRPQRRGRKPKGADTAL